MGNFVCNSDMDIEEIRRRNLWALVHPNGYSDDGVKRFAEKTEKAPERIRHLVKKSPEEKAEKAIGTIAARDFEDRLDLEKGWLDNAHYDLWGGQVADNVIELSSHEKTIKAANQEYIEIQQFNEVSGAMGKGMLLPDQPGQITSWRVTMEWAEKMIPANTGKSNLKIVTGFGDSMRGVFKNGDPLLIDVGTNSVMVDGIYFFRVGDEAFIKRLQRIPGQGILVLSSNPGYRDWVITEDMDFQVFGRVLKIWRGEEDF